MIFGNSSETRSLIEVVLTNFDIACRISVTAAVFRY